MPPPRSVPRLWSGSPTVTHLSVLTRTGIRLPRFLLRACRRARSSRSTASRPALTAGAGKTIAIVDAYDDPTAESDLAVFSSQYGLPACTTANGCFKKVNQTGGTSYPRKDAGWALEISLDVQWAHAIAPGAKILLVEASSNSFANLLAAEDYAKTHAQYVSNSWGGCEFSGDRYDSHFAQSASASSSPPATRASGRVPVRVTERDLGRRHDAALQRDLHVGDRLERRAAAAAPMRPRRRPSRL